MNIQQIMKEKQFQNALKKANLNLLATLYDTCQSPHNYLYLIPGNAIKLEKALNMYNSSQFQGIIFEPIRQSHQIQYKQGVLQKRLNSFQQQEAQAINRHQQQEKLMRKRVSKQLFPCLLLIQKIRRYQVTRFFLHLPQQMLTKLHDYTKIIQKPLDLYTIYFRILRGEYKLPDEFVDDIKTMINNAKIYFIHYSSILTDVLRFQQLFWHLYNVQIPNHLQALEDIRQERRLAKKALKPIRIYKTYDRAEKLKLQKLIQAQKLQTRANILKYLKQKAPNHISGKAAVSLLTLPNKLLREIEQMCDAGEEYQQEQRYYNAEEIGEALRQRNFNAQDIYSGSDDED